jgi:DNA ligase-1
MANRELLMLAQRFKPSVDVGGWYLSEKLDGQRCFWDGGVSTGQIVRNIPWSNKGNKHRVVGIATGLWTRYGNVICAPNWFIESLPKGVLLDGELYLGPQCRAETRSIVSRLEPDVRWRGIKFCVFDTPTYAAWCESGIINNTNFSATIRMAECKEFVGDVWTERDLPFEVNFEWLKTIDVPEHVDVLKQVVIPYSGTEAFVHEQMDAVMSYQGEGLVLRHPHSYWVPKRTGHLLKVKPHFDAEAKVIGYTGGLGRLKGMLGALIVSTLENEETGLANGIRFELAGLTDNERMLEGGGIVSQYGGKDIPDELLDRVRVPLYPIGSIVKFRYAGLTKDGVPSEARRIL